MATSSVTIRETPIYSTRAQEAISFAREKAKGIQPYIFNTHSANPKDPVNPEIRLIAQVYDQLSLKWEQAVVGVFGKFVNGVFEPAAERDERSLVTRVWTNKNVIQITDDLMKVAFATGSLMLDDLPAFTENLAKTGETRSFAEAITSQDSYLFRAFFFCPEVYENARGQYVYDIWDNGMVPAEHKDPEIIKLFYTAGAIQNEWNLLFGEYCDRVRSYVSESELLAAKGSRYVNWTRKDTAPEAYKGWPGPQPT
jgi:hypothetical protein